MRRPRRELLMMTGAAGAGAFAPRSSLLLRMVRASVAAFEHERRITKIFTIH